MTKEISTKEVYTELTKWVYNEYEHPRSTITLSQAVLLTKDRDDLISWLFEREEVSEPDAPVPFTLLLKTLNLYELLYKAYNSSPAESKHLFDLMESTKKSLPRLFQAWKKRHLHGEVK